MNIGQLNMRAAVLFLAMALSAFASPSDGPSRPFSLVVGTQSIGVRYQFSKESALVETARGIAALGSDTLKIAVTPKYPVDYRMSADPRIHSVLELVQGQPDFLKVMDMPFRNIMLWVYPFSDSRSAFRTGRISETEAKAVYHEIYEFTAFLLKRYSGTGKSFFIGNWEGDWHLLLEHYDYDMDPTAEAVQGAISWFKLREKAVEDARRDTPHEGVGVYFYVELNFVRKAMDHDKPAIVNRVLPFIKTDYVSWSSYDVTSPAAKRGEKKGRERVFQALDYIEAHLPPSDIPGKRVFIGEYGFPLAEVKDAKLQREYSAEIMKWGLQWGCPFVLYWELYDNEIDPATGAHRGYWLIDDQGVKQPVWFLHQEFLAKANAFVKSYQNETGKMPSQALYNRTAASWIEPFSADDVRSGNGKSVRRLSR